MDAAATFQNPSEYISYIAADDSAGWKLHGAIFASRSFAMAQADPSVHTRLHPPAASLSSSTSSVAPGPQFAKHSNLSHSSLHRTPTTTAPLIAQAGRVPHPSLHPQHHHVHHSSSTSRGRPSTAPGVPRPLVDLDADQSGFTGQGLLRRPNQL